MPLDIDIKQKEYNVAVRISKVVELLAAVHMLADKEHHSFDADWVKHVIGHISADSKELLEKLSSLNFPGLELCDFVIIEELYDDILLFIRRLREYDSLEFLYILFDQKISKEQLLLAQNNEEIIDSLEAQIPWSLRGSKAFLRYMITDTEAYRDKMINLLEDIYKSGFEEKLQVLQESCKASAEALAKSLKGRDPIEAAEEIKGSKFSAKANFREYIFSPSYFFHNHNIISYSENTFLMIYNINIDNYSNDGEAERLSELLKVLSDKTRLEILRQLKQRPTYGKVLASRLKLTTATISRHLDQLKSINLLKEDKSNNVKYYYVNSDEVERLFDEVRRFLDKK